MAQIVQAATDSDHRANAALVNFVRFDVSDEQLVTSVMTSAAGVAVLLS